jgi:ABC-2 type transport system permease protein
MIQRIFTLQWQDLTNSLRDNMVLYVMIGPILLTVGARLLVPSIDRNVQIFAVQESVEPTVIQRLEQIGSVEIYPDAEAVEARVLRNDDVPGIAMVDNQPVLVLEGNERQHPEVLSLLIGNTLSGEKAASYAHTQLEGASSFILEYITIVLIMIGVMLGALVMAFNIIEDKETRAIQALGVSPLSMLELTLSRGLFAIALSLVLVLIMTAIMVGSQVNYGLLLVAFLFSMTIPILVSYLIGGFSDSQLQAGAILKFFMIFYLTLPAISIFLPREWHVFLYILPNYWMWQSFESVLIGSTGGFGLWTSGVIALLSGIVLVIVLLPVMRRQLKLR